MVVGMKETYEAPIANTMGNFHIDLYQWEPIRKLQPMAVTNEIIMAIIL